MHCRPGYNEFPAILDRDNFSLGRATSLMIYSIGERRVQIRGNSWIAPNATVIGSVILEDDSSVWFNSVLRGDNDSITLGERSNIQDGCVLHTDSGVRLTIGRNVTIGHLVMLHGCTIGDGSLIGIRSVVLNHAQIGKHCLIGANTLITEGKVIRELSDVEIERLMENAEHYVQHFKTYQDQLKVQSS